MKKFFTLVAATAMAALSLVSSKSYGSHAVGADVTYDYVGPNQYLITVRFYRDCSGISAPTTFSLSYLTPSGCGIPGNITLTQVPGTGQEIDPSPCLPAVTTSCNAGSGYGVQEYVYQGLVTLSGSGCTDWTFSISECCRNPATTTVPNAANYNLYVETTLDNANFPINDSPIFTTIPVTQFCVGNQFFYNQGAYDPDGDSLVFSLVPALSGAGQPLVYGTGYSATTPVSSSTTITIDPQTGTIAFTASQIQVGIIAVLCEEYRNGIKIGEVRRDIQVNIVGGCIGVAPLFAEPVDSLGNPLQYFSAACGDTSFIIVLEEPVQCGSIVPTDVRMLTPQGQINPVLTATGINCTNGLTDSILVSFFYPLSAGITYAFTKVGFDNNTFLSECGVAMAEFDSIAIEVIDPGIFATETIDVGCSFDNVTVTFDYEIVCNTVTNSGSEFFLVDANGVNYPVTAVTNCPGGTNGYSATITFDLGTAISPATPVYLMVQQGSDANTFTNRCNTFINAGDTLAVLNVLNNLIVNLGNDQTLCDTEPLPVLSAGLSGASYSWTLDGTPLPDTTETITASSSGVYEVTVTATPTCNGTDQVTVNIIPSPVVSLGNDISLCDTDPIPTLDAGNPGATSYQWYENGVLLPNDTTQYFQPATAGTYSVIVNVGASCNGTDEIVVSIDPQLIVNLGTDDTYCANDPLQDIDAGVPFGTYVWTLNGSPFGGNTQSITPTGPGVYEVQVTSLSGCTGSDQMEVIIAPTPSVSLNNATACAGNPFPPLDAPNIPGATYQWSTGETSMSINPNAPGTYTVTVTQVTNGVGCSASASAIYSQGAPVVVTLGNDLSICDGDPTVTLDAGPGSSYAWSLNGSLTSQTSSTINVDQPGTYSVVVTDAGGCTGTDDVIVTVNTAPVINIGDDLEKCPDFPFPLLDATTSDAATYSWTFNGAFAGSGPTLQTTADGIYAVTVVDFDGCEANDEMLIGPAPCEIVIPNVFTPNSVDGLNDTFTIENLDSNPNTKVVIFNRWGNEVFSSGNYNNDWKGDDLPDGTYYYSVVLSPSGKTYNGTVKIINQD